MVLFAPTQKKKRKKKLPGLEELSDVRLVAYVESEKIVSQVALRSIY